MPHESLFTFFFFFFFLLGFSIPNQKWEKEDKGYFNMNKTRLLGMNGWLPIIKFKFNENNKTFCSIICFPNIKYILFYFNFICYSMINISYFKKINKKTYKKNIFHSISYQFRDKNFLVGLKNKNKNFPPEYFSSETKR